LNHSDKVLRAPDEEQVDTPLARLTLRAKLGKAAGAIELFQTFADFRGIERLANFLRNNAGKVGHAQLRVTVEPDVQHRLPPEGDFGFRGLGPCKPGKNKPKNKAENCALDCYRP
jgi:hypothetical protein